ncbi:MAG: site-specific integrase, partial [Actinomycetota bacterium]|nr:site-specific integrase [Actinomycetota bacterium]
MTAISVDDAIAGYIDHVSVERGLSANTVAAYKRDLARYSRWCRYIEIALVEEVDSHDVARFAASLRNPNANGVAEESILSASSAARVVVAVRSFHKFAVLEGWSPSDPAAEVAPPSIPRRLPKALPYASIEAMIGATQDPATAVGSRDRALLEVLYGTGTRISEVVGLDVDDVDLDASTVVVTGKGSKQRRLPFGEAALAALEAYLTRGRPALAAAGSAKRQPGAALF